jgi:hypothetical protein
MFQSKAQVLVDGSTPSANHEANDQYNLAMNFLVFQNDIPLARKTFKRALELDARFTSARLQHANMQSLEIYNGYTNDESVLYRLEEEVHQAEQALPASDGLLIAVQSMLYLAQGRLDRIPSAKVEEWWRNGANNGLGARPRNAMRCTWKPNSGVARISCEMPATGVVAGKIGRGSLESAISNEKHSPRGLSKFVGLHGAAECYVSDTPAPTRLLLLLFRVARIGEIRVPV